MINAKAIPKVKDPVEHLHDVLQVVLSCLGTIPYHVSGRKASRVCLDTYGTDLYAC